MTKIKKLKKIAIFRALKIGDLLCSVPAFRALKKAYPYSEISLISLPWAKEFVCRFNNYLDKFIKFPGFPGLPEQQFNPKKIINFIEKIQKERFDLVLQMQGDGSIVNSLVELFNAKNTAGFYLKGTFCPNDNYILCPSKESEIISYLKLVNSLGIPSQGDYLEFPISKKEEESFQKKIISWKINLDNYVVVHPGASLAERRWEEEKFAKIADFMYKKGFQIVLTGSRQEKSLVLNMQSHMRGKAIGLAGKTDLACLALLIKKAKILISNDTSVSHLAAAFKTRSVIISHIQSNEIKRWRPLNKNLHEVVEGYKTNSFQKALKQTELFLKEGYRYVQ